MLLNSGLGDPKVSKDTVSIPRRKQPSWQTRSPKESRTISTDAFDMVEELFCAWNALHEKRGEEDWSDMLQERVSLVVCATEELFYTDDEEDAVYEHIRSRALDVESAVLRLAADDAKGCKQRASVYDEIIFRAHELCSIDKIA